MNWLSIIGLGLNTVAAIALFLGSVDVEWGDRTWKGKSPKEQRYAWYRHIGRIVGFPSLILGFFLQFLGAIGMGN